MTRTELAEGIKAAMIDTGRAAETNYTTRIKIIGLVMRPDVATAR